jgi:hypothetical protein
MNAADGGKPVWSAWGKQKGQCSKPATFPSGADEPESCAASTILMPVAVHISPHDGAVLFAAARACETDGASDASSIATHAIHAVNRLAWDLFFTGESYHA